ncbi:MAG: hypothetical protein QG579_11 [Patescibacteria group bacterium]|nr:hypothetical protein [Patescibacteria group bacterium]
MEDYWYYTLSAIPQTLAAVIALAAAFTTLKLDYISKIIKETRIDLRRFILLTTSKLDIKEIHTIEPLSDKEFLKVFKEGLSSLDEHNHQLGLTSDMFNKYSDEMFRIINKDWNSRYGPDDFRVFGYLKMKKEIFEKLIEQKDEIIYLMTSSLILVGFVITVSLIILPSYNCFNGSKLLVYGIVTGSVISIIVTILSILKIVKSE